MKLTDKEKECAMQLNAIYTVYVDSLPEGGTPLRNLKVLEETIEPFENIQEMIEAIEEEGDEERRLSCVVCDLHTLRGGLVATRMNGSDKLQHWTEIMEGISETDELMMDVFCDELESWFSKWMVDNSEGKPSNDFTPVFDWCGNGDVVWLVLEDTLQEDLKEKLEELRAEEADIISKSEGAHIEWGKLQRNHIKNTLTVSGSGRCEMGMVGCNLLTQGSVEVAAEWVRGFAKTLDSSTLNIAGERVERKADEDETERASMLAEAAEEAEISRSLDYDRPRREIPETEDISSWDEYLERFGWAKDDTAKEIAGVLADPKQCHPEWFADAVDAVEENRRRGGLFSKAAEGYGQLTYSLIAQMVNAHRRHRDTDYDELLNIGYGKDDARTLMERDEDEGIKI
jgi:hypothetical protein